MPDWTSTVAGVTPSNPDPGPGRARLLVAVKAAEAAEPRDAALLVADLMDNPDAVRELDATHRLDPAGIAALIRRLGAVRGLQQRALKLERVIRDAAERQGRAEATGGALSPRWQSSLGQASAGTVADDLRRCLDGHPLAHGLRCPPGWELSPSSLAQLRVNPETEDTQQLVITHRPERPSHGRRGAAARRGGRLDPPRARLAGHAGRLEHAGRAARTGGRRTVAEALCLWRAMPGAPLRGHRPRRRARRLPPPEPGAPAPRPPCDGRLGRGSHATCWTTPRSAPACPTSWCASTPPGWGCPTVTPSPVAHPAAGA